MHEYLEYEFIFKCFDSKFENIEKFYAWYLSRLDYESDKTDLSNFYLKHFQKNPEKAEQIFECMRSAYEIFKFKNAILTDISLDND